MYRLALALFWSKPQLPVTLVPQLIRCKWNCLLPSWKMAYLPCLPNGGCEHEARTAPSWSWKLLKEFPLFSCCHGPGGGRGGRGVFFYRLGFFLKPLFFFSWAKYYNFRALKKLKDLIQFFSFKMKKMRPEVCLNWGPWICFIHIQLRSLKTRHCFERPGEINSITSSTPPPPCKGEGRWNLFQHSKR